MSFSLLAFKSDTLAADITDSATSMTLTTGSFGTPIGEQMLVIDYDIAAKREIVKCAIDGTAVTSIDRAQDGTAAVAHTSGAKIIMAFVPSHYAGLVDGTAWADEVVATAKIADDAVTAAKIETQEAWNEIGEAGKPAFSDTWANFGGGSGTAAYMKDSLGFVHLKGKIKSGTVAEIAFTLPAGYRPAEQRDFAVVSNNTIGWVGVYAEGYVIPIVGNNTFFTLDGISFKAEA